MKLKGKYGTDVLLASCTRTIPVVTLSSMESELAAMAEVTRFVIGLKMVCDVVVGTVAPGDHTATFDDGVQTGLEVDAQSAIAAVRRAG